MSTPRQELETRLAAFAASYSPVLTVSYENTPFTPPAQATGVMWLECYFVSGPTVIATVDALTNRERGNWVVNCYLATGSGMAKLDKLAADVVKTFKVIPKVGSVSIEQPMSTSRVMISANGWACISCSCPYRIESTA